MIEAGGEGLDLQPGGGSRRRAVPPADDLGDLDGRQGLLARAGDLGAGARHPVERHLRLVGPGEIGDARRDDEDDDAEDDEDVSAHRRKVGGRGSRRKGLGVLVL